MIQENKQRSEKLQASNQLPAIGPRLQHARKSKPMTLEQLAERSGVSKSMLSQIERGEANPTFATLWALTRALNLDLTELTSDAAEIKPSRVHVMQPHFTPQIQSADQRTSLKILGPAETIGTLEWYEVSIAPNGELASEAHAANTREHLTILEGELTVVSGTARETISKGATARYRADRSHSIINESEEPAKAILVVVN